jgi:hypothetical protein
MNARLQSSQLALQQHAQHLQDLQAYNETLKGMPPEVQSAYVGHGLDLLDALDKRIGTQKVVADQQKTGGGGISGFFKSMFSRKPAQAPASATPGPTAIPTPPASPTLQPISPDSMTHGDLGEMMGRATAAQPLTSAPVSGGPAIPNPPTEAQPQAAAELSNLSAQSTPTAPPAAATTAPVQHDFMPSPMNLLLGSRDVIRRPDGSVALSPQGQPMHTVPIPRYAAQHAQEATQTALTQFEQALQKRPDLNTLDAIYADPQFGPAFAHITSGIQGYENTEVAPGQTFVPKGTLEQWKMRFPDARPGFDKASHDKLIVEQVMGKLPQNTGDPESDIQAGIKSGSISQAEGQRALGYTRRLNAEDMTKQQPAQRQESAINKAYLDLAHDPTNVQAKQVVGAHQARLRDTERGKMLPIDQLRQEVKDEMDQGIKNGPKAQELQRFMPIAQPPQQSFILGPGQVNQASGVKNATIFNTKSGQFTTTSYALPPNFDHESLQDKNVQVSVPRMNPVTNQPIPGAFTTTAVDVYNPEKVKAAFESGAMGPQALSVLDSIAHSGSFRPGDEEKMLAYLKTKQAASTVGTNRY